MAHPTEPATKENVTVAFGGLVKPLRALVGGPFGSTAYEVEVTLGASFEAQLLDLLSNTVKHLDRIQRNTEELLAAGGNSSASSVGSSRSSTSRTSSRGRS